MWFLMPLTFFISFLLFTRNFDVIAEHGDCKNCNMR
ncbi:hypothetical protein ACFW04_011808 [Cataglyphis niger]